MQQDQYSLSNTPTEQANRPLAAVSWFCLWTQALSTPSARLPGNFFLPGNQSPMDLPKLSIHNLFNLPILKTLCYIFMYPQILRVTKSLLTLSWENPVSTKCHNDGAHTFNLVCHFIFVHILCMHALLKFSLWLLRTQTSVFPTTSIVLYKAHSSSPEAVANPGNRRILGLRIPAPAWLTVFTAISQQLLSPSALRRPRAMTPVCPAPSLAPLHT